MTRLRAFLACLAIAASLILAGTLDAQTAQSAADHYVSPLEAKLNAP